MDNTNENKLMAAVADIQVLLDATKELAKDLAGEGLAKFEGRISAYEDALKILKGYALIPQSQEPTSEAEATIAVSRLRQYISARMNQFDGASVDAKFFGRIEEWAAFQQWLDDAQAPSEVNE